MSKNIKVSNNMKWEYLQLVSYMFEHNYISYETNELGIVILDVPKIVTGMGEEEFIKSAERIQPDYVKY